MDTDLACGLFNISIPYFGSPVFGRKKLNYEGHYVHKGGTRLEFMGFFSFVTFVYFVVRKIFPLKRIEPLFFKTRTATELTDFPILA